MVLFSSGSRTSCITPTVTEAAGVEMPLLFADGAMLMSMEERRRVSDCETDVKLRAKEVAGDVHVAIRRTSRQRSISPRHHPQPSHPKRKSPYFDQPTRFTTAPLAHTSKKQPCIWARSLSRGKSLKRVALGSRQSS